MAIRKSWFGACGGVVLAVAGAAYVAITQSGFDADRWKAQRNSTERDNPRGRMLGGVDRRLRPGMTQGEVLALLGEPERVEEGRSIYELGVAAYGIDEEYLVLEFDTGGRFRRHWMSRR